MTDKPIFPPAPTKDRPVKVSLEITPEWLAFHNLEIVGWDEHRDGILVRRKTHNTIPASSTSEVL